ncbi:MAG TPA: phosphotransferase [Candidatus Limnocylindria bacterium]
MTGVVSADWLAAQRWFRAKHRRIAAVSEIDRAPIGPGALVVIEVAYADGGSPDCYLVPLVSDREPADGDGLWAALVEAVGGAKTIGRFVARPSRALAAGSSAERRLAVEQSNTSVVIGERLILKLYRLLEAGENPDVEIGAFLADAGFTETPALAGSITWEPDSQAPRAAVMLQELVATAGDGWSAMLAALGAGPARATELAADVGALTARLHRALASRPETPGFPSRAVTVAETGAWRASAERQLATAISALNGAAHEHLVALAPAVTARFADTFGAATGEARVSRIHGDYHLGQLLARADGGMSVIDFEGEPARPLAERRLPSSPLRDVAGMLRSLDYAARTAERAGGLAADAWLPEARASFLGAYEGAASPRNGLLDAFELEKACYEVRYEAANRPDWLWLPLAAIDRLVASS